MSKSDSEDKKKANKGLTIGLIVVAGLTITIVAICANVLSRRGKTMAEIEEILAYNDYQTTYAIDYYDGNQYGLDGKCYDKDGKKTKCVRELVDEDAGGNIRIFIRKKDEKGEYLTSLFAKDTEAFSYVIENNNEEIEYVADGAGLEYYRLYDNKEYESCYKVVKNEKQVELGEKCSKSKEDTIVQSDISAKMKDFLATNELTIKDAMNYILYVRDDYVKGKIKDLLENTEELSYREIKDAIEEADYKITKEAGSIQVADNYYGFVYASNKYIGFVDTLLNENVYLYNYLERGDVVGITKDGKCMYFINKDGEPYNKVTNGYKCSEDEIASIESSKRSYDRALKTDLRLTEKELYKFFKEYK